MTATLSFSLPDEHAEFRDALEGTKWRSVCEEMDQYLRDAIKHDTGPLNTANIQNFRDILRECATSRGLSFDS